MPNEARNPNLPPSRRGEPKGTIGASVPVSELKPLHLIATERKITLTRLLTDAIDKAYPKPETD